MSNTIRSLEGKMCDQIGTVYPTIRNLSRRVTLSMTSQNNLLGGSQTHNDSCEATLDNYKVISPHFRGKSTIKEKSSQKQHTEKVWPDSTVLSCP